jgi:FixJ family two-component response regulator
MENAFESRPKIFVVDDEPEIAKMLAVVLQLNLFDAVAYFDPVEALEAAKETPPDCLISDVQMPGMNGIDLGIAVMAQCPACKVLLFSGQVDAPKLVQAANEAGHAFEFLHKPVHPKVLAEVLLAMGVSHEVDAEAVVSEEVH